MVWPALWEQTQKEISKLHASGKNIIFVEAAVLRQAGWEQHCHEFWVCIIPTDEVFNFLLMVSIQMIIKFRKLAIFNICGNFLSGYKTAEAQE